MKKGGTMVHRYLGQSAFAERIGVKPDTLHRYTLPPHDAEITTVRRDGSVYAQRAWLPDTVDEWNAQRPAKRSTEGVRVHVQELRAAGMSIPKIAERAGVSRSLVERLLGKNPQKFLLADGVDKLMAVKP